MTSSALSVVQRYVDESLIPFLDSHDVDLSRVDLVLGGSVSFGFADSKSDVDVFLYFDDSMRDDIMKARSCLFAHNNIGGHLVQVVPYPRHGLELILSQNGDVSPEAEIEMLYAVRHFVPLWDPESRISRLKAAVAELPTTFWRQQLETKCRRLIDTLEGFYRGLERDDAETGLLLYGPTIQAVLQAALLSVDQLYPIPKWLTAECRRSNEAVVLSVLRALFGGGLKLTCDRMSLSVRDAVAEMCQWLESRELLAGHYVNALRDPSAK